MKILSNYTFQYQKRRCVWFFGYSSIWKKFYMIPEQWTQVPNKNAGIHVAHVQLRKSLAAFPTIRDWEVVRNFVSLLCSANRYWAFFLTKHAKPMLTRVPTRIEAPYAIGFRIWAFGGIVIHYIDAFLFLSASVAFHVMPLCLLVAWKLRGKCRMHMVFKTWER